MKKLSIRRIEAGPVMTNCYIVTSLSTAAVMMIDPGDDAEYLAERLSKIDVMVYTHGHFDHSVGAAGLIRRFNPLTMMHEADVPLLEAAADSALEWGFTVEQPPPVKRVLVDGDRIEVGDLCFSVIHTPGHSPGCICLYGHGVLFSGDTLFRGSIGRTDLPGSSMRKMNSSLQRIVDAVLPETVVYPGHGPSTTLRDEIDNNPFVSGRHLHHLPRD